MTKLLIALVNSRFIFYFSQEKEKNNSHDYAKNNGVQAEYFFDDQTSHPKATPGGNISMVHVPFGIANRRHQP